MNSRAAIRPRAPPGKAPIDFQTSPVTRLQPDLLVVRREEPGRTGCKGTALLLVEIPSYWVVDPAEVCAVRWTLEACADVEIARVSGEASVSVTLPFAFSFAHVDLVGRPSSD